MKKIHIYFLILFASTLYFTNGEALTQIKSNQNKIGLISLNFRNIAVRDLLHILAKFADRNFIISNKIEGNITINLTKINWRTALAVILKMQNLLAEEINGVIYIKPEIKTLLAKETPPLEPMIFKIHYAHAETIVDLLQKSHGFLSATGSVVADQRTNSLLIKDSKDQLKIIKQYLEVIDIPVQQIMIEARIIYADENFVRELGLKFGTAKGKSSNNAGGLNMDLPIKKIADPGHATFAIAKLGSDILLDLELSALENEGRGRVISNPKLVTANRESAYIEAGDEIPYQEKTVSGATSVVFKKAVLGLKVIPEVVPLDQINLHLQLNQDKVSANHVNGEPTIQTRQIQTQVSVKNGQTIVLGGIYEESKYNVAMRIPFLSAIPLLGLLFQNRQTETERKELLIFVTPKIING